MVQRKSEKPKKMKLSKKQEETYRNIASRKSKRDKKRRSKNG